MKIKEIAGLLESSVNGDPDFEVKRLSEIKDAQKGDLVFFFKEKKLKEAKELKNLAAIVPKNLKDCSARSWIKVEDVKASMLKILKTFYPASVKIPENCLRKIEDFGHVKIGKNVRIGENVTIGSNCILGNGVNIFPSSYIGNNVEIGDNSIIYPHSVILDGTKIGHYVKIYPGVVIGSDGFGYHRMGGELEALPHIGIVVIGDRVEVGALTMIDRGTLGNTIIGAGTKIDNSVHIAHNVKIGKNVIILAQVGIAGSCEVGDNVVIAGQVGIADHVKIGKNAVVAAKSGVAKDVKAGEVVFGYPAGKRTSAIRNVSYLKRLPGLFKRVKALEKSK
ncbi:UDP-3-O-(3-hydroxymyristoyl)glucosamine N-acyltransferase [candidate division WOR-3 bacterium]|nr:UDP-3-O-(3-hydroxymyristoyl)glucosamine N-acyltransferase [candidate division WOR-3 bacterium]